MLYWLVDFLGLEPGRMSGGNQFQASLSDTTLPEMLSSIHRFQVAGVIEARQGDIVKRVYIRDGHVVHASSTDRRDRLGEHLLGAGKLTDETLQEISRQRQDSTRRFGVLLIERELLAPIEVYRAIREHIEEIVWSLFQWSEGEVRFEIGEADDPEMVRTQIPMRQVILEGIRRAPDARSLVSRLGKRETVLEPCFGWEDLIEIGLGRREFSLLMLVDAQKTLYELCSTGPLSPADNAKLLYAFQVLNLVRRRTAASQEDEGSGPVKIKLKTTGDAYAVEDR